MAKSKSKSKPRKPARAPDAKPKKNEPRGATSRPPAKREQPNMHPDRGGTRSVQHPSDGVGKPHDGSTVSRDIRTQSNATWIDHVADVRLMPFAPVFVRWGIGVYKLGILHSDPKLTSKVIVSILKVNDRGGYVAEFGPQTFEVDASQVSRVYMERDWDGYGGPPEMTKDDALALMQRCAQEAKELDVVERMKNPETIKRSQWMIDAVIAAATRDGSADGHDARTLRGPKTNARGELRKDVAPIDGKVQVQVFEVDQAVDVANGVIDGGGPISARTFFSMMRWVLHAAELLDEWKDKCQRLEDSFDQRLADYAPINAAIAANDGNPPKLVPTMPLVDLVIEVVGDDPTNPGLWHRAIVTHCNEAKAMFKFKVSDKKTSTIGPSGVERVADEGVRWRRVESASSRIATAGRTVGIDKFPITPVTEGDDRLPEPEQPPTIKEAKGGITYPAPSVNVGDGIAFALGHGKFSYARVIAISSCNGTTSFMFERPDGSRDRRPLVLDTYEERLAGRPDWCFANNDEEVEAAFAAAKPKPTPLPVSKPLHPGVPQRDDIVSVRTGGRWEIIHVKGYDHDARTVLCVADDSTEVALKMTDKDRTWRELSNAERARYRGAIKTPEAIAEHAETQRASVEKQANDAARQAVAPGTPVPEPEKPARKKRTSPVDQAVADAAADHAKVMPKKDMVVCIMALERWTPTKVAKVNAVDAFTVLGGLGLWLADHGKTWIYPHEIPRNAHVADVEVGRFPITTIDPTDDRMPSPKPLSLHQRNLAAAKRLGISLDEVMRRRTSGELELGPEDREADAESRRERDRVAGGLSPSGHGMVVTSEKLGPPIDEPFFDDTPDADELSVASDRELRELGKRRTADGDIVPDVALVEDAEYEYKSDGTMPWEVV